MFILAVLLSNTFTQSWHQSLSLIPMKGKHNFLGSKFYIFQAELNGMVTKSRLFIKLTTWIHFRLLDMAGQIGDPIVLT